MSVVQQERTDDGIVTVTLNRPEKMNSMSGDLRHELAEIFKSLHQDESARVVILTGAGPRAFCAGLDLRELGGEAGSGTNDIIIEAAGLINLIETLPKPVIGAINGVAITGGFELALACDILIASTTARFADTHGRVGILPGWGLSQKLSRLIGINRAKELSFTGNFIDAATAQSWGLINRAVPPEQLLATAHALAKDMLSIPPEMQAAYKSLIDDGYAQTYGDGLELELARGQTLNASVSADEIAARREAIQARARSLG